MWLDSVKVVYIYQIWLLLSTLSCYTVSLLLLIHSLASVMYKKVNTSEKQRYQNFTKDHCITIPTKTFHLHDVFPALRLYISLEIKFEARLSFKARPKILRPTLEAKLRPGQFENKCQALNTCFLVFDLSQPVFKYHIYAPLLRS